MNAPKIEERVFLLPDEQKWVPRIRHPSLTTPLEPFHSALLSLLSLAWMAHGFCSEGGKFVEGKGGGF
jgi:hypothetical protein